MILATRILARIEHWLIWLNQRFRLLVDHVLSIVLTDRPNDSMRMNLDCRCCDRFCRDGIFNDRSTVSLIHVLLIGARLIGNRI